MSKIKVNSIEASTGSTITIPSGQTLDISATTLTLPSTVVTTTGTQTLTNKTIGVSQLSGTLPVANGGTGLTTLGSATQVLRVNSGATALEFATAPSGKVLQVVNTFSSTPTTYSGTSYAEINSAYRVTITPSSASNKILIICSATMSVDNSTAQPSALKWMRSTGGGADTDFLEPTSVSSRLKAHFYLDNVSTGTGENIISNTFMLLDSPSTTSSIVYKLFGKLRGASSIYINRGANDSDNGDQARTVSSFYAIEIQG
jgi:hypothetical protein